MIKFIHHLPRAKFLGCRDEAILKLCKDKIVLHLGFVNEGFLEDGLRRGEWLHGKLIQVARRVVGIDISEHGLSHVRQLGYTDCYYGDVEKLSEAQFPRLEYDVILAADIIEHLQNPGMFLHELRKVAHEKTNIIITTPNALSVKTLVFPLAKTEVVHPDHNFYYSPTTLMTLLKKYHFNAAEIGLYSSVWIPRMQNITGVKDFIGKAIFSGFDFFLQYSLVRIFPYYSEGMLLQTRKEM